MSNHVEGEFSGEGPPSSPVWPSGDCKIVLQIAIPLLEMHSYAQKLFSSTSEIMADDDHDGLGAYKAFHATGDDLGLVAFVAYENAPNGALNVVVDAESSTESIVALLLLLSDVEDKIVWVYPELPARNSQKRRTAARMITRAQLVDAASGAHLHLIERVMALEAAQVNLAETIGALADRVRKLDAELAAAKAPAMPADLVEQQIAIQRVSLEAQRRVIQEVFDIMTLQTARIERLAKEIGSGRSTSVGTSNEIAAGRRPHRERD